MTAPRWIATRPLSAGVLAAVFTCLSPAATRAQATQTYEPLFAQPGKDVVWVPTPEPMVALMLDMAKVTAGDLVVDLGSGDGRLVIAAAKRGARARGVEFNPDMVQLARRRAIEAGVKDRATFVEGDMFAADVSDATVLALFLLTENMKRLQPTFLALRPGTRIVSNTFGIPEWPADERITRPDCSAWCTALLWIVPAQVHGAWQIANGPRLEFDQHFQKVTGRLAGPVGSSPIQGGTIRGAEITFTIGDESWQARLEGDRLVGTRDERGRVTSWTATRIATR
ncbi:methyltransferase [Luteitalea sp. TBR-22]|uniref:class I SAM-dependent methyltransferase n=1 Tax=Luteitalea sp. TBR-22 TaxID=2802971 RepID=UPI001AF66FE6|nr:class I SAM-dependent methyltransferase [Luteitalea sp. TBR-22]BCS34845.1 methyltransferase [Luteitalea sp. TBR-22]